MSSWNFRIVKTNKGYGIYYAYYDDKGNLNGISETAMSPVGEDIEDLKELLTCMFDAFEEETIDINTL